MSRKSAIKTMALTLAALPALTSSGLASASIPSDKDFTNRHRDNMKWKGNIQHSVCYWVYHQTPLAEFCTQLQEIGVQTIDLIGPQDWGLLQKLGMNLGMANGAEISLNEGWNHIENHDRLIKNYLELIPRLASFGFNNLICFSGQSKGLSLDQGLDNCVKGLEKILPTAEQYRVTLSMELLNSKIDHIDYQCDHSVWGIALCKRFQSERFKLLFDIYHMQIMEGDIIRTIQDHHEYFSHYHTGGVPGRHEIDATQELNYPAIMQAIVGTGFKGSVAQEFMPSRPDLFKSLTEAFRICDV